MRIRLREVRRAKDITQEQLSDISGISRTTIALLESGVRTDTTIGTLAKLASALGCDLSELIFLD